MTTVTQEVAAWLDDPTNRDAVDMFAGPGGWDVAARALGLNTLGIEWDHAACMTREAVGHLTIETDVTSLDPRKFAAAGEIASPPCQGFSGAGNGKGRADSVLLLERLADVQTLEDLERAIESLAELMTDEKTLLALEPLRWALTNRPDWIAWEQVIAVLPIWEAAARILGLHGYTVDTGILSAEQFGVPQTRRRAILVARSSALSVRLGPAKLPTPTHSRFHTRTPQRIDAGVPRWVSMAEALGWAPSDLVGFPRRYDGQGDAMMLDGVEYRARDLRSASLPSFVLTEKARSWTRFPGEPESWLGSPEHGDGEVAVAAMGDVRNANGCVRPIDAPAPTLTASMDNGNFQFVTDPAAIVYRASNQEHAARRPLNTPAPTVVMGARSNKVEWMPRELAHDVRASGVRVSVAEAACLQTFPADYPWSGTRTQQFQQVGNAIPPVLAFAVLAAVTGVTS